MPYRTYIPKLVQVLKWVCRYIVAHRARIVASAPPTTNVKLDNVIIACEAFLLVVGEHLPDDTPYP